MSQTSTTAFPLATEDPFTGNNDGAPGYSSSGSTTNDDGGASGTSSGYVGLSHGAMIAIIIIVIVVAIAGIVSAVLFYVAKKNEWRIRETIRKSARKVVDALTPRRSEFPRSVKEGSLPKTRNGRVRIDDVPPTPRLRREDIEKGRPSMDVHRKFMDRA